MLEDFGAFGASRNFDPVQMRKVLVRVIEKKNIYTEKDIKKQWEIKERNDP